MARNNRLFYYLLLLFSTIFWGVSFIFTKSLLETITPIAIIFFRLLIASTLLIVVTGLFYRPKWSEITVNDFINLFALSCFEPFLYFLFETYSLQYADPTVVSVIIATIPVFTLFLSIFYFKENLTRLNIIGVFISVLGIVVMLFPDVSGELFHGLGVFLAACAVLSSVGYSFFIRKVSEKYHPVFIVTCQNTIGGVLFLPLFLLLHNPAEMAHQWSAFAQPHLCVNLLVLAVCCSSLAFIFYVKALQKVGLGRSQTFTNLIPVVTAIFSYFALDEKFTVHKIAGTLIVIIGVYCVQKKFTNPADMAGAGE